MFLRKQFGVVRRGYCSQTQATQSTLKDEQKSYEEPQGRERHGKRAYPAPKLNPELTYGRRMNRQAAVPETFLQEDYDEHVSTEAMYNEIKGGPITSFEVLSWKQLLLGPMMNYLIILFAFASLMMYFAKRIYYLTYVKGLAKSFLI